MLMAFDTEPDPLIFFQERLTAKEAMAHPYFAPVRSASTQSGQNNIATHT